MESRREIKAKLFDLIYNAALKHDRAAIADPGYVDTFDEFGLLTPTGLHAKEGHIAAVKWLVRLGANENIAGMGAAMGRQYELVDILRAEYGASVQFIAKGAAIAGDDQYIETLLSEYRAHKLFLVEGAAMRGDWDNVRKYSGDCSLYLSKVAKGVGFSQKRRELEALIGKDFSAIPRIQNKLAYGAMLAGDVAFARELYAKGAKIEYLIEAAVQCGDKSFIVEMREHIKWNTDPIFRTKVLDGFVKGVGRDISKFEWLSDIFDMAQNSLPPSLIRILAKGSMKSLPRRQMDTYGKAILKQGYLVRLGFYLIFDESLFKSAGKSGQFDFVNDLVVNKPMLFDLQGRMRAFCAGLSKNYELCNDQLVLHRLSFSSAAPLLIKLRTEFSSHLKDSLDVKLIPKAIKINQLMKKYGMDYDMANAFLDSIKLRRLFLYIPFNLGELPVEIGIVILNYFSPLTFLKTQALYNKVSLFWNKEFLASDLAQYNASHWVYHRQRAQSLRDANQKCQTRGEFIALIRYQSDLFQGKAKQLEHPSAKHEESLKKLTQDRYTEIVEKHNQRLTT